MTHQEEIIDIILSKYSKRNHKEHLQYEAKQMMALLQPVLVEMGYMDSHHGNILEKYTIRARNVPKNFTLEGFLYEPNPPPDLSGSMAVLVYLYLSLFLYGVCKQKDLTKSV